MARKTFRKKSNARRAAKRSHRKVYKVKSGWRLGKCSRRRRRR